MVIPNVLTLNRAKVTINTAIRNNLTAYWSFDGSGDSILIDSVTETTRNAIRSMVGGGTSFSGNGLNTYIDIPTSSTVNADLINATAFTIAGWFRFSNTNWGTILEIASFNGGGISASTGIELSWSPINNDGKIRLTLHNYPSASFNYVTNTVLSANTWYHIAVTYQRSGRVNIYVNGVIERTYTGGAPINWGVPTYNVKSTIGANWDHLTSSYKYFLNGEINELAYWKRELSGDEILMLYNNSSVLKYPLRVPLDFKSLISYYNFNNGLTYDSAAKFVNSTFNSVGLNSTISFDGSPNAVFSTTTSRIVVRPFNTKPSSLTVAARVYPTSFGDYRMIFQNTSYSNPYYGIEFRTYTDGRLQLVIGKGSTYQIPISTTALTTNTWQYVAAVLNSTDNTVKFYINGALESTFTYTGTLNWGNDISVRTTIGASDAGTAGTYLYPWAGRIDELSYWYGALTDAQILSLYNNANPLTLSLT